MTNTPKLPSLTSDLAATVQCHFLPCVVMPAKFCLCYFLLNSMVEKKVDHVMLWTENDKLITSKVGGGKRVILMQS